MKTKHLTKTIKRKRIKTNSNPELVFSTNIEFFKKKLLFKGIEYKEPVKSIKDYYWKGSNQEILSSNEGYRHFMNIMKKIFQYDNNVRVNTFKRNEGKIYVKLPTDCIDGIIDYRWFKVNIHTSKNARTVVKCIENKKDADYGDLKKIDLTTYTAICDEYMDLFSNKI